jgi:hypothetical protein
MFVSMNSERCMSCGLPNNMSATKRPSGRAPRRQECVAMRASTIYSLSPSFSVRLSLKQRPASPFKHDLRARAHYYMQKHNAAARSLSRL